jgi:hypothetical protein
MLTFYCDTERKKILTVSYFDVNPSNLRVSTFSLAGRLERVSYFEFPNGVPYPNLILPGTLALSESGGISFTSLHEVRSGQSQNETADKDKYRSIEITSSDIP